MAPTHTGRKALSSAKTPKETMFYSTSEGEDMHQDSTDERVNRLARKMISSSKKRRSARRTEIETDFLKKAERIEIAIGTAFEEPLKQVLYRGMLRTILFLGKGLIIQVDPKA
ncbi:hypothetical protein MMC19_006839 [Ptychographa xylographoides]|nr:hypothetical protein [Ptychographa xylographoides]